MTPRETYFRALRRETTDRLIWAPNFDHWHAVNTANGTIPEEYRGMSCNDVLRAVGATIWRRVGVVQERFDSSVTYELVEHDTEMFEYYRTPLGDLQVRHQQAPDLSKAWFRCEHRVKTLDDMRILRYLIEATYYELDDTAYRQQDAEVGDDGILLTSIPCIPFIQFAKNDVGYADAYYLMADYPDVVQDILDAYERKFLDCCRLAAQGPCELVSNGDNMDQLTCPPAYFQQYAVPFYHQVRDILHASGKIAQGHWCGKLDQLLPLIPDCGLDVIEAVTPEPMSRVNMRAAMDLLEGKITIQGGVPSVCMCNEGCSRDELADYIRRLLDEIGHCRGFILGMGDNVPPNADFARVKMISEIVEAFNQSRTASAMPI